MEAWKEELYHHGIKGQHWGVRRFQNEDGSLTSAGKKRYENGMTYKEMKKSYNSDRKAFKKEADTDEGVSKKKKALYDQADKKEKEAQNLYKKYNFDGDDGGGGKTKADEKAGAKYMKLYEDAERLRDQADYQSHVYVQQKLLSKYGKESLNQFHKDEAAHVEKGMKAAAGVIMALSVSAIGYAIAADLSSHKK